MTTTPIHNLTDVWNDVATTFNAIKMNVTDTASADASKLFLLQVGGTDVVAIDKSGAFQDSLFALADNADRTKKVQFQVSGVTTGFTRTLTVPDFDGTIATLAGTETFTNKTIDSANNTLTLDLSEGTLTGTLAEFNTALSDENFVSIGGAETLTNKNVVLAAGSLSTPSLRWDTGYGWSYDSGNNRLSLSCATDEGFFIQDNGANKVSFGHPHNRETDFPSFEIDASFDRGPKLLFRSAWCGDPGDTPELGFIVANGTAASPSAWAANAPTAFMYWTPYDTNGNIISGSEFTIYSPLGGENRFAGAGTTDTFSTTSPNTISAVGGDYAVYQVAASSDTEASRKLGTLLVKDTDYTVSGTDIVLSAGNLSSGQYLRIMERTDWIMNGPFYGRLGQVAAWTAEQPTSTARGGYLVSYAAKQGEIAIRPYSWISDVGNMVVSPWHANMGSDGTYPDTEISGSIPGNGFAGSHWTNGPADIRGPGALNVLVADEGYTIEGADMGAGLHLRYGAAFNDYGFSIDYDQSQDEWEFKTHSGANSTGSRVSAFKIDGSNQLITIGGVSNANRFTTFDNLGRLNIRGDDNSAFVVSSLLNYGIQAAGHGVRVGTTLGASPASTGLAGYYEFVSENSTHTGATADSTFNLATALNGTDIVRFSVQSDGDVALGIEDSRATLFVSPEKASAQVNGVQIYGAATGASPVVSAYGSDTNINAIVSGKGTGDVRLRSNSVESLRANQYGFSSVNNGLFGFNLFYDGAWKFIDDGYGWTMYGSNDNLVFAYAGLNASGADAAATPATSMSVTGSGLNLASGKTLSVNGTQVVGARVVNSDIADPNAISAYTAADVSGTYVEAEVQTIANALQTLRDEVADLRAKLVAANTTIRTHGLGATA